MPQPDVIRQVPQDRTYYEYAPPPHLRLLVVCFWRRRAAPALAPALVLPDGCVDIIWSDDRPPFVAGPMTRPVRSLLAAESEIIGVRFRPGVAQQVLGVDASALRDLTVPLHALWPRHHTARWEEAVAEQTMAMKLAAITHALTLRQREMAEPDPLVARATRWIAAHPRGRLETLVRNYSLSERQLRRRRFHLAVGYGPKQLQRIVRLQYLLWLASRDCLPHSNLARLAAMAGYADQPHMTREVQALTGSTPAQLLVGTSPLSAVADLFHQ